MSFLVCSVLFCAAVLCCSVLCCAVLFCSVLFCSVLFCSVLFCSVLFCFVLICFFSVLSCLVLSCSSPLFYYVLYKDAETAHPRINTLLHASLQNTLKHVKQSIWLIYIRVNTNQWQLDNLAFESWSSLISKAELWGLNSQKIDWVWIIWNITVILYSYILPFHNHIATDNMYKNIYLFDIETVLTSMISYLCRRYPPGQLQLIQVSYSLYMLYSVTAHVQLDPRSMIEHDKEKCTPQGLTVDNPAKHNKLNRGCFKTGPSLQTVD